MSSSWGSSWKAAWGNAWGIITSVVTKHGGDDAPGEWRKIKEKPVKINRNTIRAALRKIIEAGEEPNAPDSIQLEAQGKIEAPKIDWVEFQRDLDRINELFALANQIELQQQEDDDEETLLMML